jgi:hypothetical protein
MRTLTSLALLAALFVSPVADAAARLITRASVGPVLKTYVIPVRNCARDLTHVRIDVSKNPIFVQTLGVKLSTGQSFSQNQNKIFPVGAGQWTDISPARNLGCITQVFAIARSEGRGAARISAYGNFQ